MASRIFVNTKGQCPYNKIACKIKNPFKLFSPIIAKGNIIEGIEAKE